MGRVIYLFINYYLLRK